MRSLHLRQGVREARQAVRGAGRLIGRDAPATLALGALLVLLPATLQTFFSCRAQRSLLDAWAIWADAALSGAFDGNQLLALLSLTQGDVGTIGLMATALGLALSLLFKPLLLSALALLYNGRIDAIGPSRALAAGRQASAGARDLIVVALLCMVAEWFVQAVPAFASGLLTAVAGLLSFIPILGTIAVALAAVLSELIALLTDMAVTVIFCYVWISASCEGVPGFGALVRSWQLTRNAMHRTFSALIGLTLLRLAVTVVFGALWALIGHRVGVPLTALVYAVTALGAVYTVMLGATTSALYQCREVASGPAASGQFRNDGPDLSRMKRANLDDE